VTIPFLHARTLGGAAMTLGHFVFAYHTWAMATGRGPARAFEPPKGALSPEGALSQEVTS
jgi:cytochrome c oxidase cbb3-type subunit 1